MIDLSNTTLWSSVCNGDKAYFDAVVRVLRYCNMICKFQKTILFSHIKPPSDLGFEVLQIPTLNQDNYNLFINRTVPLYMIGSEFSMCVHDDGFPIDPSLWEPAFQQFDYIGAPWPDGVVGNSGFSLESKKMNDAKIRLEMDYNIPKTPSDVFICRTNHDLLVSRGIIFAPTDVAERFSVEQTGLDKPSFGFHGKTVALNQYAQGWKAIEASEK